MTNNNLFTKASLIVIIKKGLVKTQQLIYVLHLYIPLMHYHFHVQFILLQVLAITMCTQYSQ